MPICMHTVPATPAASVDVHEHPGGVRPPLERLGERGDVAHARALGLAPVADAALLVDAAQVHVRASAGRPLSMPSGRRTCARMPPFRFSEIFRNGHHLTGLKQVLRSTFNR